MITYLIKSSLCLALLLAFYHLFLEREKMHKFNRFYLLGSVLFSFLAPLYIIYTAPVSVSIIENTLPANFEFTDGEVQIIETPINYWLYTLYFSLAVSGILLLRFLKNLNAIYSKVKNSEKVKHKKAVVVLVKDAILPHSFWKYIFINKEEFKSEKIQEELYTHELTHVTQKHTFDVLLIELLTVAFWFNPIFYLLRKAIKLNHEFLADTKVVNSCNNVKKYQYLLLNRSHKNEYYLASNLNYLLTKKRLKMMTKQSSTIKVLLKKLAVIPILLGALFLFAERVEAQEETKKQYIDSIVKKDTVLIKTVEGDLIEVWEVFEDEGVPTSTIKKEDTLKDIRLKLKDVNALKMSINKDTIKRASIKQLVEYNTIAKKHNSRPLKNRKIKVKDYKRLSYLFEKLSNEQKKNSQPFPKFPPPPKIDLVYTYKKLAHRIKTNQKNRKANIIWLKEIYQKKMNNDERNKVSHPSIVLANKSYNYPIVNSKKGTFTYKNKNGEVITKKFTELTEEEKKMIPPPPPPRMVKKGEKSNIPPPPPPPAKYKKVKKGEKSNIPPPPPPAPKSKKSVWKVETKINNANYNGKEIEISEIKTEDYFNSIERLKNLKKNYFLDEKQISKEEYYKLIRSNSGYNIGSSYANKEKSLLNMYISKSKDNIEKLVRNTH